ncbi:hypothetical protein FRY74_12345 [Vicingus serpentipes]|uniref:Lipoprotein n=1 Tax=Vicingus serpentipes TaxID=1926625 RepID=A0A5C6RQ46_9FLAO|nr:hypothetical protein [Vicingus serpentipes]TXB64035.1 hypothetical protein FRY74_12345 [Vicingus serpentipes]
MKYFSIILIAAIGFVSCSKDDSPSPTVTPTTSTQSGPNLIFKLYFDSTLARLDNLGNPSTIPTGNSAQSPVFHKMSAHYIEFAPDSLTALGNGEIVYHGAETSIGGSDAVDFSQARTKGQGEVFYTIPLSQVSAGTYKWLRVSLTYQNYDIKFLVPGFGLQTGRLASFVGFNTYITSYVINSENISVNGNKLQGYWGFETNVLGNTYISEGQSLGTTVPNPISNTSPIPSGSCVVTGNFPTPLTISGNETTDITVNINLSTNNSFEWRDINNDGYFEPSDGVNPGDTVVDMGLRGLFPTYQ